MGAQLTSPCSEGNVATTATIPNPPIAVAEAIVRVITHEIADRTEGSGLRNLSERRPALVRAASSNLATALRTYTPSLLGAFLTSRPLIRAPVILDSLDIHFPPSPSEQIRLLFEHMDCRALKTRPGRYKGHYVRWSSSLPPSPCSFPSRPSLVR